MFPLLQANIHQLYALFLMFYCFIILLLPMASKLRTRLGIFIQFIAGILLNC